MVNQRFTKDSILVNSFFIQQLTGVLAFLATVIIGLLEKESSSTFFLIIVSFSFLFKGLTPFQFYFYAQKVHFKAVLAGLPAFILSSVIKLFLVLNNYDFTYLAFAFLIDIVLNQMSLWLLYPNKRAFISKLKLEYKVIKSLLYQAYPLFLSAIFVTIYLRIDQVMLMNMTGEEALGIYSVAVRMVEVWYFLPSVLITLLFPSMVKLFSSNPKIYWRRFGQLNSLLVFSTYLIIISYLFFGKQLLGLIFGDEYVPGFVTLLILSASLPFTFLGVSRTTHILNINYTKFQFISTFFGALLNIVLNYLLLPLYSYEGAAWSTLISYSFSVFWICLFFPKTRKIAMVFFKNMIFPFSHFKYLYEKVIKQT